MSPVPLIREPAGWRFDTAAGREEIITRRIGRNELSVIEACETYVLAQHAYAAESHDGKPSGVYAAVQKGEDVDEEWDLLEAEERELSAWRLHFGEAARAELMANGNARVRI